MCIDLTPNGTNVQPHVYAGQFACYPGVAYTVTAMMRLSSIADGLQVGVDWYDAGDSFGPGFLESAYWYNASPASNSTWFSAASAFAAPTRAVLGRPWCGIVNVSPAPPAGHVVHVASVAVTTPYE